MYVGACQRKCNITINHARMEYNALGYSGTNSGGSILIENSLFQYNQDGLDTNTQIAGDPPPPQDGSCPAGEKPKIKGAHNCWILYKNTFQYNNQIVPTAGNAGAGPMGTGLTIAGGRNDSLIGNTFKGNKAWGVLVIPFADSDTPPAQWTCASSGGNMFSGLGCIYDSSNIEVVGNTFSQNGAFGNPTNGDIGQLVLFAGAQQSCYSGNVNKGVTGGKATTFPTSLQTTNPTCTHALVSSRAGAKYPTTSLTSDIVSQVLCDTGFGACPTGNSYPGTGPLAMHPLPTSELKSMPNPCLGVPSNAWCSKGKLI